MKVKGGTDQQEVSNMPEIFFLLLLFQNLEQEVWCFEYFLIYLK